MFTFITAITACDADDADGEWGPRNGVYGSRCSRSEDGRVDHVADDSNFVGSGRTCAVFEGGGGEVGCQGCGDGECLS